MDSQVVAGLDIGTTKVCAVIGGVNESNKLEILGVGVKPVKGVRKGVVINIDSVAESILSAVEEAELQAGKEVTGLYVGVSGGHIEGTNSRGVVAISNKERGITKADIDRVIEAATNIIIPVDREVVHVLPQEFIVDDHDGVKDPIGMSGIRLEAIVHVITASASSINNLMKAVRKAGFEPVDIVLEPLAAAYCVLTEEEKELGCVLIDIGGGTTDYVIFEKGSVRNSGVLTVGGTQVTNDIAAGIRTTINKAEEIKINAGNAVADYVSDEEYIQITGISGKGPVKEKRKTVAEIIQMRYEELFIMIREEIERIGRTDFLAAGAILTGGGALTKNLVDLASEILKMPVRLGIPQNVVGLKELVQNPVYSTAVGLALYAKNHRPKLKPVNSKDDNKNINNIVDRIKGWLKEFF